MDEKTSLSPGRLWVDLPEWTSMAMPTETLSVSLFPSLLPKRVYADQWVQPTPV